MKTNTFAEIIERELTRRNKTRRKDPSGRDMQIASLLELKGTSLTGTFSARLPEDVSEEEQDRRDRKAECTRPRKKE